jgi:hypothetical protein
MFFPRCLFVISFCLTSVSFAAIPQEPPSRNQKAAATKKKSAPEVDPLVEARRTSAMSMLNALAEEARSFRDPMLRARVQARAADTLWQTDTEKARALFQRAWDAAVAADEENERLTDAERRARANARGTTGTRDTPSLRREVLRLAGKRDKALGEEFLARMDEARKQEQSATGTNPASASAQTPENRINPDNPPAAMLQRLSLAREILEDGDTERAMQFADPALYPINTFGMNMLDVLRERDANAANGRYIALLRRAATDPLSDANTVSLLSSYVLTPYLYITVRPDGQSHTRRFRRENAPPSDLAPSLRDGFLRSAAQILLRPLAPPDQDRTSSGRTGTYVVITRLAPVFERYMPDAAAQLRVRQSALMQDVPERNRRPDDPLLTRGLVPEVSGGDAVQAALDRIPNAKSSAERDQLYFRAAMAVAENDLQRARELVGKIEDVDLRRQLLAFLSFQAVQGAIRGKRAEDVVRLSRSDELTNVHRAWALTEAARLLAKSEQGRAIEILDDATVEARKIDQASPDRASVLVAIVTQLHKLDRARAWEVMNDVVKTSNGLPAFSGEDGGLTVRVEFRTGGAMTTNFDVPTFDLTGVFDSLARDDFDRAAEIAKSLSGESPRAVATIAVARAVLDKRGPRNSEDEEETR